MFACPGCGDNLRFDIESQKMHCRSCGGYFDVDSIDTNKETIASENTQEEKEFFETTFFHCPQCGGEMIGDETDATMVCSYCGANNVLETRLAKEKRPNYIIPFKITKKTAQELFLKHQQSQFWVDKNFKNDIDVDNFRAIYVPYYAYDIVINDYVRVPSQKVTTSGNYTITDYYNIGANIDAEYQDIALDASSSFYDNIASAIAPFDRGGLVDFKPQYLSGFYGDIADVPPSTYGVVAREIAEEHAITQAQVVMGGLGAGTPEKKDFKINTDIKNVDRMMYPVWFLSYKSRGRVSYATVNGQTGKIAADAPLDVGKFIGFSLLVAAGIFFILNFFLTLRPSTLLGFIALLSALVNIIYFNEMKEIFIREQNVGDLGLDVIDPSRRERIKKAVGDLKKKKEKRKKKPIKPGGVMGIVFLAIWGATMVANVGRAIVSELNSFGNAWGVIYALAGIIVMVINFCNNIARGYNNVPGRIFSIFNLICISATVFINLAHPAQDIIYYASTGIMVAIIIALMIIVIANIKRLSTRPMPQFNKKGGDDDGRI